jgi:hypothetical protein
MNGSWLAAQFKINPKKTRAGLAAKLGLDPPAISKILGGKRQIKAHEYLCMREYFELSDVSENAGAQVANGYVLQPFARGLSDGGGDHDADQSAWVMPARLLQEKTKAAPEHIRIFDVQESAMAPDFLKGEQVLVDLSDRNPSPPGIFVVSDGISHMVRSCEYVPHSDPPKMKLNANNQKFSYVMELDQADIIGRVIAKLQWL